MIADWSEHNPIAIYQVNYETLKSFLQRCLCCDGSTTYPFVFYNCDRLCENPPCSRILHCFTKTAVKS